MSGTTVLEQDTELQKTIEVRKKYIEALSDETHFPVATQLQWVDDLAAFDLGRYLLRHKGFNGYWRRYMICYPEEGGKTGLSTDGGPLSEMESFILNKSPIFLAFQERYQHFQSIIQSNLRDGISALSIPCGAMEGMLRLNYRDYSNISLTGVDLDQNSLDLAQEYAEDVIDREKVSLELLLRQDIWTLKMDRTFNIIRTNGMCPYEPNESKVVDLYRTFYNLLSDQGMLVFSFVTPSPEEDPTSIWKISGEQKEYLIKQEVLLGNVIQAGFLNRRKESKIRELLAEGGFKDIQVIYDSACINPIVVARKA